METEERLRKALEAEPDVTFAQLFGSRTGASSRVDSDWDVGVFVRPELDARARMNLRLRLIAALEPAIRVDIVVLNDAPPLLAHRALGGRTLVVRDRSAYVRFFVRTLALADDDRVWAQIHDEARSDRLRSGTYGRS